MDIKFNVKDKSLFYFLSQRLITILNGNERRSIREDENPYYFLQDEMFLKKAEDLKVGDLVTFQLEDASNMSRKSLLNIYTYRVQEYDDVCVKLVLEDFKITVPVHSGPELKSLLK